MFATPNYNHLFHDEFEDVYEPAEDTFLVLEALEADYDTLRALSPRVAVEVGCGSGVVSSFLAQIIGNESVLFATDISPIATRCARKTASINNADLNIINVDLLDPLLPRLKKAVDVVIFNPPYVPTPAEEVTPNSVNRTWAGGIRGRQVIDKFLPQLSVILSPSGIGYLVLVRENDPDDVQRVLSSMGLISKTLVTRKAGNETLSVLQIKRKIN